MFAYKALLLYKGYLTQEDKYIMNYKLALVIALLFFSFPAFAQDWSPSEDDKKNSEITASQYLKALDEKRYEDAYNFLTVSLQNQAPFESWIKIQEQLRDSLGKLSQYSDTQAQWLKDPENAPLSGIYAVYRLNGRYSGTTTAELLVLHQQNDKTFQIMRHEINILKIADSKKVEELITLKELNGVWVSEHVTSPQSVQETLVSVQKNPDITVSEQDGWLVATSSKEPTIWSFTIEKHPAHPAYAKRWPVIENGNLTLKLEVACEADKATCDRFAEIFTKFNQKILEKSKFQ